jgi:hypothetical protein
MTTMTMRARPGPGAVPQPVPWRRMAWVTWRQHRVALAGVAALLAAWAVYLWIGGLQLHHAYATVLACHPANALACQNQLADFDTTDGPIAQTVATLLQVVPVLIGAFTGAPILARELETGTFRYAWTQGFGRRRWALAKLVILAVTVTAAAAAFSLMFSWYYQPLAADGYRNAFTTELFTLRWAVFGAWTLAAFAIGALAGMLIRRVVPAIAATLAVYAGLAVATGLYLREHYMTPLLTSKPNVPGSAWVLSQWWTKGSATLTQSTMNQVINGAFYKTVPALPSKAQKQQTAVSVLQYLSHHGYTQWTSYQPGSRFWPFQWIETGWLAALALLLIGTTIWLVRRRAT